MVRLKSICTVLLPLLLYNCSSDSIADFIGNRNCVSLSAVLEQHASESRTSLSSNAVVWNTGDKISILSEGENDLFVLSFGASSSEGIFEGEELPPAERYYALYPYSRTASFDGQNICFSLPEVQNYYKNSFGNGANPTVATFTDMADKLQFRNICGVLSLYLKGTGNLLRIELTGKDDEYLWGDFLLKADGCLGTDEQTLSYQSGGGRTVILNCGDGVLLSPSPVEFNIVVPANSFSQGFDVTCFFSGESSEVAMALSSSRNQAIKRSERHIMAEEYIAAPIFANLENDQLKAYLDYAASNPYPDGDFSITYIENYYNVSTTYRKDQPYPVHVVWDKQPGSSYQYLTVSPNSDFSEPYYDNFEIDNSASSYDIYNLIPGKKYYYKVTAVVSGVPTTLVSSEFNTLGRRRMLNIDGTFNVRDLGGISTSNGRRIKYGKLFRGGRLNENNSKTSMITDAGRISAMMAGIGAEMDLRNDSESGNISSSYFNYGDHIALYQRFPDAGAGYYGNINTQNGYTNILELQWVIDRLKDGVPVYYHCSAGADRVGTISCLMEGLLGVPENQMSVDYEITSFASQVGLRKRTGGTTYSKYHELYAAILSVPVELDGFDDYPTSVTTPLQKRFYNYFYRGITKGGVCYKISKADLDWFIDTMLE